MAVYKEVANFNGGGAILVDFNARPKSAPSEFL